MKAKIPVFFFQERRTVVAYSPVLDLSSCGATLTEAQRRFTSAVSLFFEELEEMGTTAHVLTELGWHKIKHPHKEWIPPHLLKHTQLEVRVPVHA